MNLLLSWIITHQTVSVTTSGILDYGKSMLMIDMVTINPCNRVVARRRIDPEYIKKASDPDLVMVDILDFMYDDITKKEQECLNNTTK